MRISLWEDQSAFSGHTAHFPIPAFERVPYLMPLIRSRGSSPSRLENLKSSYFIVLMTKFAISPKNTSLVKS